MNFIRSFFGFAAILLAAAVLAGALAPGAAGHGGYPLRIGVRQDAPLAPLSQLLLVYLEEGSGLNVDRAFAEDAGAMEEAFRQGTFDIIVDLPPRSRLGESCDPGGGAAAAAARGFFEETYPGAWTKLFGFHLAASPCAIPALIVHPRAAGELRFPVLREVLERFLSVLGAADVEAVRDAGGGARRSVSAARDALLARGLL